MRATAQGRITFVGDLVTSKNGTQLREIMMDEINIEYPKQIAFKLFKERAAGDYAVGHEVEIECNIASREYNGKFYSDITAYKINIIGGNPQYQQTSQQTQQQQVPQPQAQSSSDDLPF